MHPYYILGVVNVMTIDECMVLFEDVMTEEEEVKLPYVCRENIIRVDFGTGNREEAVKHE